MTFLSDPKDRVRNAVEYVRNCRPTVSISQIAQLWDDMLLLCDEIERLRTVATALHDAAHGIAGEGGLNWRVRLQEACWQYREDAQAAGGKDE